MSKAMPYCKRLPREIRDSECFDLVLTTERSEDLRLCRSDCQFGRLLAQTARRPDTSPSSFFRREFGKAPVSFSRNTSFKCFCTNCSDFSERKVSVKAARRRKHARQKRSAETLDRDRLVAVGRILSYVAENFPDKKSHKTSFLSLLATSDFAFPGQQEDFENYCRDLGLQVERRRSTSPLLHFDEVTKAFVETYNTLQNFNFF
jgi:hypothetical protein